MGRNAEQPRVTLDGGGGRSATPLSPAVIGQTSFGDPYQEECRPAHDDWAAGGPEGRPVVKRRRGEA